MPARFVYAAYLNRLRAKVFSLKVLMIMRTCSWLHMLTYGYLHYLMNGFREVNKQSLPLGKRFAFSTLKERKSKESL